MNTRICIDCGGNFPLDQEHFTPKGEDRFDTRCKECRKKERKRQKALEDARKTSEIESTALEEFVKSASRGGENVPHSCELLEKLMSNMGGVTGFATLLTKQYFDAPPGSGTRTKIADTIVRLVTTNTDQGGSKKPMEQWTDEELEDELNNRLRRIAGQGSYINVIDESQDTITLGGISGFISENPTEGITSRDNESVDRSIEAIQADGESKADTRVEGQ